MYINKTKPACWRTYWPYIHHQSHSSIDSFWIYEHHPTLKLHKSNIWADLPSFLDQIDLSGVKNAAVNFNYL